MPEPKETLADFFERQFDSFMQLLKRRTLLAVVLLFLIIGYCMKQYIIPVIQEVQALSGPPAESSRTQKVSNGAAGWIYVGTQIGGQWKHSVADGDEPSLTLALLGFPEPSKNYEVIHPLYLREAAPTQRENKSRPPMTDSKGTIGVNSVVKVDSITKIEVAEIEFRSWVWAHVTVIEVH